ncbi:MAG: FAD:protein FMN transferase [Clostridia bacterium]|nr:FAD:protein FMN transferase [Clostridia bacterium]
MLKRKGLALFLAAVLLLLCGAGCKKNDKTYAVDENNAFAMGTFVSMKLYSDNGTKHSDAVLQMIYTLEDTISWRKENSPVAALNRTGRCTDAVVAEIISQCAPISKATGGRFDLTVGAVSTLWDFDNGGHRPLKKELQAALELVDYTALRTKGDTVTCADGQQLDLGAVGKGLACDLAIDYLKATDVKGAVLSVGGSIGVFGSRDETGDPWRVGIRDPFNESGQFGVITLKEGFVSTSGDYEKYFEQDGKRYFHILDATTGLPAKSGLKSVTVLCDNGMLSDALSTACFLLGEEASHPLLERYNAAAVFVDAEGNISIFGDIDFARTDES